jgi:pimeloyl-ACP methyl ester carboxylesterase
MKPLSALMPAVVTLVLILAAVVLSPSYAADPAGPSARPTIVLVHGAFADSSSWNPVITRLLAKGYPVIAVAIPLRGLKSDADYVGSIIDTIPGSVILVGHSYGGSVISAAGVGRPRVNALVFVSAFAPEQGETAAMLAGKFPGGTLADTLAPPTPLPGGGNDIYILQNKYRAQFAADVDADAAKLMAATQRPITDAALNEPFSGTPAWKSTPSWFLSGSLDKNIPAATHAFMAKRAHAKQVVEVAGASHVVMITHPDALVKLIDQATADTAK